MLVIEISTVIPNKYAEFANIFSTKNVATLLKYIRANNHTIKLIKNQKPFYEFIHSLVLVELKTLKIDIEANLANDFIESF